MNDLLKQIIAFSVSIIVAAAIYFGAYLPLRKSQMHIDAILNLQNGKVHSVGDLNDLFDPVLDFYSPIGQDEITSYYLGILINIINQQTDRTVIDVLAKQAENRMAPILQVEKGFSFNQNLYTLGSIYKIAAIKFKDKVYYDKAVNIFQEGLEYSPKRLIFLKGLFDLYSVNLDDQSKAREVGEIILKNWPDDKSTRDLIDKIK